MSSETASPNGTGNAERAVRHGMRIVLGAIVLTLVLYLIGDRITPYTQQARIAAFVIGVAPKVAGEITQVWVSNDQPVRRGDPLFQIDERDYRIALRRATADLDEARSNLAAARSAIDGARARLQAAEANLEKARKDAIRQETLYRKDPGAISVRRVEMAQASLKQAEARVAGARADVQKAIEREKAARERLLMAQSLVEKAQYDLDNTRVRAPTDGVITDLQADVGHFASRGQAMMTLLAKHNVWIEAQFTENNLGHLTPGTPVEFVLDALPGRVFQGEVRSIGLGVSSGRMARPGTLPSVQNNRDWLRSAQRFPVEIRFAPDQPGLDGSLLRVGGQAEVIAYTEDAWLMAGLGRLFIRFMSLLSYAY